MTDPRDSSGTRLSLIEPRAPGSMRTRVLQRTIDARYPRRSSALSGSSWRWRTRLMPPSTGRTVGSGRAD